MVKIKDITNSLEKLAPLSLQENYDNSGLITGNSQADVTNILISLDCTEEVVNEAISKNCNLIVAHHPIIFRGLKSLTGKDYVERTIIKAIKNDIAIYAIHTNLDNVAQGVNQKICNKLALVDTKILSPKANLKKLETFIPINSTAIVLEALHISGAGSIGNYSECSFIVNGVGRFKPGEGSNPKIGKQNKLERIKEDKVEVIFPDYLEGDIIKSLKLSHPYEEVAYYINTISNKNQDIGSGMIGRLENKMRTSDFMQYLKSNMELKCIRHTKLDIDYIEKVAVCGGSGSFLLETAKANNADIFVSSDFKYHEFFDADGRIIIADIGHYESEVFTKELIHDYLCKNFTTFAVNFAETITNPIWYLT